MLGCWPTGEEIVIIIMAWYIHAVSGMVAVNYFQNRGDEASRPHNGCSEYTELPHIYLHTNTARLFGPMIKCPP